MGFVALSFTGCSEPKEDTEEDTSKLPKDAKDATELTVGGWTDFNIAALGEKWFKFTSVQNTQYIHIEVDSLLAIQLYSADGNAVGENILLSDIMSTPITVTEGNKYYIKVTYYTGGANRISLTLTSVSPAITLPTENITEITAVNTLTAGNIASKGVQWFKFTATADSQYIIFKPGTLNDVYVQVYDSNGIQVGSKTELYKSNYKSKVILHTYRAVTSGQVYYIKVTPYSTYSGAYQIMFSDSFIPQDAVVTQLTIGKWADGNIIVPEGLTNEDVEQWYKFTASASTKFIHVDSTYYKIQLFDINGTAVGEESMVPPVLESEKKYVSITVTSGNEYYIRVKIGGGYFTGDTGNKYKIGITESSSARPAVTLPTENITQLTENKLFDGGELKRDDVRWFKFTATATTQYIHFIISGSTYETTAFGQLYDNTGVAVGEQIRWSAYSAGDSVKSWTVVSGNEYYLKVTIYYSSGIYQIGFNTTQDTRPKLTVPNTGITDMTISTWSDGNLAEDDEQWFKFTGTPSTQQYLEGLQIIHFKEGTLKRVYVELCTEDGTVVENITNLYGNSYDSRTNRPVTSGTVYYIRVTPYNSSSGKGSGTYNIAYSASTTTPTP